MGRQTQACPGGFLEPRAGKRLPSFRCLPQINGKVLKGREGFEGQHR